MHPEFSELTTKRFHNFNWIHAAYNVLIKQQEKDRKHWQLSYRTWVDAWNNAWDPQLDLLGCMAFEN